MLRKYINMNKFHVISNCQINPCENLFILPFTCSTECTGWVVSKNSVHDLHMYRIICILFKCQKNSLTFAIGQRATCQNLN